MSCLWPSSRTVKSVLDSPAVGVPAGSVTPTSRVTWTGGGTTTGFGWGAGCGRWARGSAWGWGATAVFVGGVGGGMTAGCGATSGIGAGLGCGTWTGMARSLATCITRALSAGSTANSPTGLRSALSDWERIWAASLLKPASMALGPWLETYKHHQREMQRRWYWDANRSSEE